MARRVNCERCQGRGRIFRNGKFVKCPACAQRLREAQEWARGYHRTDLVASWRRGWQRGIDGCAERPLTGLCEEDRAKLAKLGHRLRTLHGDRGYSVAYLAATAKVRDKDVEDLLSGQEELQFG